MADQSDSSSTLVGHIVTPNLDHVFDDPDEGEFGRDRMLVHGLWELLLAVAVVTIGFLLSREQANAFTGSGLRTLLLQATTIGLLAMASALALRAAVPNLAVGPVAVAAAVHFGQHSTDGLRTPLLVMLGLAALVGLGQAIIVVGFHVPAWAASFGVGLGLMVWANEQRQAVPFRGYDPSTAAVWWFTGFCVLSVVASVVWAIPRIRRALGRFRPVSDPARRRGVAAAFTVIGATVISTMLAAVAGFLSASMAGQSIPVDGFALTAVGLGAALLGGTSAFGRRGGITGTVLASALFAVTFAYLGLTQPSWSQAVMVAIAIVVGLMVTRLVERFGRPAPAADVDGSDGLAPRVHSVATTSWTGPSSSWQTVTPPAVPTPGPGGIWSDESWGRDQQL